MNEFDIHKKSIEVKELVCKKCGNTEINVFKSRMSKDMLYIFCEKCGNYEKITEEEIKELLSV